MLVSEKMIELIVWIFKVKKCIKKNNSEENKLKQRQRYIYDYVELEYHHFKEFYSL